MSRPRKYRLSGEGAWGSVPAGIPGRSLRGQRSSQGKGARNRPLRELLTNGRRIADDTEAYVIAEIGHNHQGSLHQAERLVRAAVAAGAHAVKLQKRENKALFTTAMYNRPYESGNSFGATYGKHREALEFGRREYVRLSQLAADLGVDFFATAFDPPSVDFVDALNLPAIKIASGDLTNTPLLKYAAETGRPLIVSTGGAAMDDVRRAADTILPINTSLVLLQCTAVYPANPSDLNLAVIGTYRDEFADVVIGFSGHDAGPELSCIAYALGARVIEKHFTRSHNARGSDHHFSLDPCQLDSLCAGLERTREALGSPEKVVRGVELPAIEKMGKKLVAARDLPAGHVLSRSDVTCESPGDGIKPYRLDNLLGRRLLVPVEMDDTIRIDALGPERSRMEAIVAER